MLEGVVLKDEAYAALLRRKMRCVGSQDVDVALIRLLEPRDNPQEGRFAAAARTEKRRQRARGDRERNAIERDVVTEPFRYASNRDRHSAPPS